jgi:hypothetical protein
LGYRQIKLNPKDYLDGACACGVSPEYTFMSFDFCLVPATYESTFLEYLNKLVVEPIDDILIFSNLE